MPEEKHLEGFLPQGFVIGSLRGNVENSLTIAGTVEEAELKVTQFTVVEGGVVNHGEIEAESVSIEGSVTDVVFRAGRLVAGAQAHIADCVLEMENPTGCAIHEEAHFEGDVKIIVARSKAKAGKSVSRNGESDASLVGDSSYSKGQAQPAEVTYPGEEEDVDEMSAWPSAAPDISEADEDAHIPLGD